MIGSDSRWNFCPVIRVIDDTGTLVENEHVDMPYPRTSSLLAANHANVTTYLVHDGDTWSGIAARFLKGRSDLWWVIAELSGVIDPFKELVPGLSLSIPTFDTVVFDILNFSVSAQKRSPLTSR